MVSARAPFRVPRAAAVAVTVLALAAGAHLLAGGELPAFPVMTALAAVVALSAVMLAGTKMTAPVLAGYLGTCQAGLHLAFSALSGAGSPLTGNSHHPGSVAGPGIVEASVPHEHLSNDASPGMLGMHIVAVLVTALLMARGEAALWALAAWLRPLIDPPTATPIKAWSWFAFTATETIALRWKGPGQPPARGPPPAAPRCHRLSMCPRRRWRAPAPSSFHLAELQNQP
ncbi:hypothetical protein [Arthrobacter sp. Rue61a]|uniref:hypothetical protein n=1 Tax=Arthrobacter sp. Rue61a TaxID=1118963 RepID=UPI00027DF322|nr:hypothetical protein [Arthrobacter sp. Rue61a]AFR31249.1 hypothetical protein ARUE_232p00410 [Arthrobacter sp. Rue61a]